MVCVSVLLTVVIIHFGFNTRPMPRWVEWLVLETLGKVFCLDTLDEMKPNSVHDVLNYENGGMDMVNAYPMETVLKGHDLGSELLGSNGMVFTRRSVADLRSTNPPSAFRKPEVASSPYIPELSKIVQQLEYIRQGAMHKNKLDALGRKWKRVATIIDRTLLYSFVIVAIVTTVVMMTQVKIGGERDYDLQFANHFRDMNNETE